MPLTVSDHRKHLDATMTRVADFIRAARRDLGQNRSVDLTGLEDRVRALYDAAKAVQDNSPTKIDMNISVLQADLHALGEDLTTWYEANKRDNDAAQRHSAVSAYGKASDDS